MRIAGFGDPTAPHTWATRVFRRHKAEKCHQLTRVIKPSDVADLNDEADGGDKGDAAQGLQGIDDRRPARGGRELAELVGEAPDPAFSLVDRVAIFLQRDVLRCQRETEIREPPAIRLRPARFAGIASPLQ